MDLIERVVVDPEGRLPPEDVAFVHGLEEAFGSDMPAWMQTERELKRHAKQIIKQRDVRPRP